MKKSILFLFLCLSQASFAADFTLESPAFKLNSVIPINNTCYGKDLSPPLTWQNIPEKTASLALVVEDPDAPDGVWTHWVLFNISPTVTGLPESTPIPQGAAEAKNSWGTTHYRGPCPSLGMHSYVFKLYALDNMISALDGADKDAVMNAMTGHVIGTAKWVGLYQRQ